MATIEVALLAGAMLLGYVAVYCLVIAGIVTGLFYLIVALVGSVS